MTGDNTYLKKAVVLQKDRQLTIEFDAMIDCSGNAIVAELSDHPLVENHYFQAASINFYIENSQIGDNELSNFKLIRDLKTIIQQQQLPDYFKNFGNTLEADQNNNLSLKVIYFLDYLDIKKWGKKKK